MGGVLDARHVGQQETALPGRIAHHDAIAAGVELGELVHRFLRHEHAHFDRKAGEFGEGHRREARIGGGSQDRAACGFVNDIGLARRQRANATAQLLSSAAQRDEHGVRELRAGFGQCQRNAAKSRRDCRASRARERRTELQERRHGGNCSKLFRVPTRC
ncbi:MAG TPA: hypothetical protein VG937_02450 [Polyangiaceae bacterium]|nr:hypothetical protein [Polyangiaceae bacterium]